ncbi:MAG: pyrimidine 5'-nucleotidase [Pseudomonadota bacterium]
MLDKARRDLAGRDTWVFDLDNTLYPAACDLFAEIDSRMTDFVSRFLRIDHDAARTLQKKYYAEHGTTLKGLMTLHGMAPDEFLHHVHEIDLSPLPVCDRLQAAIAGLPGKKYVYTNGSKRHAERVTRYMELDHLFDGMSGIEDSDFHPKPDQRSYDRFCDQHGIEPRGSVFFEDLARNLAPAHAMGFATVLVHSEVDWSHEPEAARPAGAPAETPAHVDFSTGDLTGFLSGLGPGDQNL